MKVNEWTRTQEVNHCDLMSRVNEGTSAQNTFRVVTGNENNVNNKVNSNLR